MFTLPFICASGFFELRLTFDNRRNLDAEGQCCDEREAYRTSTSSLPPSPSHSLSAKLANLNSGAISRTASAINNNNSNDKRIDCPHKCRTFFKVCLKHYQKTVTYLDPCTFGEYTTQPNGDKTSVLIPFNFTWPEEFSLVIEAYHQELSPGKLI